LFFDFLRLPTVYAGDCDCDGGISSGTTTLFLLEILTTGGRGALAIGALALGALALGTFAPGTAGFANQLPILL
jgi:hypothetical protein